MSERTILSEQTIFRNAKLADGSLADFFVTGDRFSAIAPAGKAPPADFAAVAPGTVRTDRLTDPTPPSTSLAR